MILSGLFLINHVHSILKRILLLFFILIASPVVEAQVPLNLIGNNPPGLKWKQLNTDYVQVIFPENSDSAAQRIARIIHALNENESEDNRERDQKVSIVVQSNAAVSNGFVTVGPFRSEFFPAQRQFGNSTNYLDILTIHEYRHVQQFSRSTRGITKTVKAVLGSWAWGGMMATALPRWYFEGDAVSFETEYTLSGRGRLPSFNMEYYALFNDDISYDYEKAGAGSIRDFVPDWYPLGYNMISYGKREFGEDLWEKVVDDAVRYKGLFFPFSRSLKKHTNLNTSQLYQETFKNLRSSYSDYVKDLNLNEFEYIGQSNQKKVINYSNPKIYNGDTILIQSSYDEFPSIIKIGRDKKLKKLTTIGRQIDGTMSTMSIGGDYLVWAQFAYDLRWRYKQYNDVYSLHIPTGLKTRITSKERYFSPSLSLDGARIAAIAINEDLSTDIHILSSKNGDIIKKLNVSGYSQLAHPCWIDDNRIVVVASMNEKSSLVEISIEGGTARELIPPSADQLSFPFVHNHEIAFAASFSGINNIYKINSNSNSIGVEQLTEVPVGAFQPFISDDSQWLLYTEMSHLGMKAKKMHIGSLSEKSSFSESIFESKYQSFIHNDNSIIQNISDTIFQIGKFNKWSGILNPHSILAEINHPYASVSLLSDNLFGTLSGRAGAEYNYNENDWTYSIGFTYAELFPQINLSYVYANRSAQLFNFGPLTDTTSLFTVYNQSWKEDRVTLGFTIPLNFSGGNVNAGTNISTNYQYASIGLESAFESESNFRDTVNTSKIIFDAYDKPIEDGSVSTLDVRLTSFALLRTLPWHLNSRLGGVFSLRYRKQLGNQLNGGDVLNINTAIYLPGLAPTHSFFVTAAFQKESVLDNYRYSDVFNYSRGYDVSLRRDKFLTIGINYSFPVFYPDIAIGPLAFIKRVKANTFFDYGKTSLSTQPFSGSRSMNSVGLELGIDFRAFRLVEVDLGVRYSYLMNPELLSSGQRHQFDFFVISITQ